MTAREALKCVADNAAGIMGLSPGDETQIEWQAVATDLRIAHDVLERELAAARERVRELEDELEDERNDRENAELKRAYRF